MRSRKRPGLTRAGAVLLIGVVLLAGCTDTARKTEAPHSAPAPLPVDGECSTLRIAYDPSNGYEASAFIVGTIAAEQLQCSVEYVETSARQAWKVVADGRADVYLDAYGNTDLRERLAGRDRRVSIIGSNGIQGGVDLLAPEFMVEQGLSTAQDLEDVRSIGWGITTPAITTVPALLSLAEAFVDFQRLDDYVVRDYDEVGPGSGMADLLVQAVEDDQRTLPNLYLVEGPLALLGDNDSRRSVPIPESADTPCEPQGRTTVCSLADFHYQKIVNTEFAASGSPAYSLVYNYRLNREDAGTILELVELSGYDVGAPDVASWLNTHEATWRRWIP